MGMISGTPFIGLPGNPVAAFVTFAMLAQPLMQLLGGEKVRQPWRKPVQLGFDYRKKANRREYVRVRLAQGDDGASIAHKACAGWCRRHHLADADRRTAGVAGRPATMLAAGETVRFLSWAELFG